MNNKELYQNGSGYYDPTAYKAILNVINDEKRKKNFLKDLFRISKQHGFYIDGKVKLIDAETREIHYIDICKEKGKDRYWINGKS